MKRIDYTLLEETHLKELFGTEKDGSIKVPTASHNNCGSRCVIQAHLKDGKILGLSTEGGEDCPQNLQIRSCLKGHSYLDTFLSTDRILYPMRRIGKRGEGKFQRISWEEAIDFIVREMTRVKHAYGPASRFCTYATGYEMCAAVPSVMIRRLLALDGGYLGYYNNYSCSPSLLSAQLMYGSVYTGNSRSDYVNSKLLILWGFNPAETSCGGNTTYALLTAKRAGAKIIVIDPRFSDTAAALADEWIAPLPTTDNALADAMAYTIYKKGLHDQEFLDTYCLGFEEKTMPKTMPAGHSYLNYLLGESDNIPKTPSWASAITNIPADIIETLAVEYATTKPAAILEGYGPGRHAYGEQFSRGLITLACMTGNVGIAGGSAAGLGLVPYGVEHLQPFPGLIDNPYPGKIPCFCWTDALEHAGDFTPEQGLVGVEKLDTEIKMIFNLAGNCLINQHSDCNHTARLLADTSKVECIVCSDIFMTPSARFADILLPGTTMLETENITASPARFDYFFKINPVMEPPGECRFDYDWICDVAQRLGLGEAFSEGKTLHQWLCGCIADLQKQLPDFPNMDVFTRQGVYKRNHASNYIAFQEQIRDFTNHPFDTPSGRIEIFSPELYRKHQPDINPLPSYIPAWEGPSDSLKNTYPLQCIGFHSKARAHSVHDNNQKLQAMISHELWIHPADAALRGIEKGSLVYVYNRRGKLRIRAKVTERIRPGVVAIPQGAWFTPDEDSIDLRGCINTLTSLRPTPIAHANAQHTCLVEVTLAEKTVEDTIIRTVRINRPDPADTMNCMGCLTCIAACPHGNMKVLELETGDVKKPVRYIPLSCGSCREPACVNACPIRILS